MKLSKLDRLVKRAGFDYWHLERNVSDRAELKLDAYTAPGVTLEIRAGTPDEAVREAVRLLEYWPTAEGEDNEMTGEITVGEALTRLARDLGDTFNGNYLSSLARQVAEMEATADELKAELAKRDALKVHRLEPYTDECKAAIDDLEQQFDIELVSIECHLAMADRVERLEARLAELERKDNFWRWDETKRKYVQRGHHDVEEFYRE